MTSGCFYTINNQSINIQDTNIYDSNIQDINIYDSNIQNIDNFTAI